MNLFDAELYFSKAEGAFCPFLALDCEPRKPEKRGLPREYHHSRVPKNVNLQEEYESNPSKNITTLMILGWSVARARGVFLDLLFFRSSPMEGQAF